MEDVKMTKNNVSEMIVKLENRRTFRLNNDIMDKLDAITCYYESQTKGNRTATIKLLIENEYRYTLIGEDKA